jgi:hypothetical protein
LNYSPKPAGGGRALVKRRKIRGFGADPRRFGVACSGIRRGDQQGLGIDFGLPALGGPTKKWIACRLLVQRRKCREIGLSFSSGSLN